MLSPRISILAILVIFIAETNGSLFKTKEVPIEGAPGDYYVISATAEDPFQSLEMNLVCSSQARSVFIAKIDSCQPQVFPDEYWHFHYNCDLTVDSEGMDRSNPKSNAKKADSNFLYRRRFLLSIGIEDNKFVLWNGDRRKPLLEDYFLRFMGKAELFLNETCPPDCLVVKGTVWNISITFIKGKIPETATFSTLDNVRSAHIGSNHEPEGSGIVEGTAGEDRRDRTTDSTTQATTVSTSTVQDSTVETQPATKKMYFELDDKEEGTTESITEEVRTTTEALTI